MSPRVGLCWLSLTADRVATPRPLRCNPILPRPVLPQFFRMCPMLEVAQSWSAPPHAADAVNGGGEIAIQTRRDDNQTVVEIIDNDPGISLENLSHIFKPFFTTKGVGSGKGLGLTISQGIVGDSTTVRSNSNQRQLKRDSSCDCRCCRLKETKAPAGTCSLPWQ